MKYNIRFEFFLLVMLLVILSPHSNVKANEQEQLTISVNGADQGSSQNNYYVAIPTDGSTDTITITGGGANLNADDSSLTCTNCSGNNVDPTSDSGGQISYNFSKNGPGDTGTQSGDDGDGNTITLSVNQNTPPGTYSYSLDSVTEDFVCPNGSLPDGSGTGHAEDDQGSQNINVIVYSVTTVTLASSPSPQSRKLLGINEEVNIIITPNISAKWNAYKGAVNLDVTSQI